VEENKLQQPVSSGKEFLQELFKALKRDLFPTLFLNTQDCKQNHDEVKRQNACKRTG
jgi:hypothetical protein